MLMILSSNEERLPTHCQSQSLRLLESRELYKRLKCDYIGQPHCRVLAVRDASNIFISFFI